MAAGTKLALFRVMIYLMQGNEKKPLARLLQKSLPAFFSSEQIPTPASTAPYTPPKFHLTAVNLRYVIQIF